MEILFWVITVYAIMIAAWSWLNGGEDKFCVSISPLYFYAALAVAHLIGMT